MRMYNLAGMDTFGTAIQSCTYSEVILPPAIRTVLEETHSNMEHKLKGFNKEGRMYCTACFSEFLKLNEIC